MHSDKAKPIYVYISENLLEIEAVLKANQGEDTISSEGLACVPTEASLPERAVDSNIIKVMVPMQAVLAKNNLLFRDRKSVV